MNIRETNRQQEAGTKCRPLTALLLSTAALLLVSVPVVAEFTQEFPRAENDAMGLDVDTPAGSFEDCFSIIETSELDPGEESEKIFCPWVGVVADEELVLVDWGVIAP